MYVCTPVCLCVCVCVCVYVCVTECGTQVVRFVNTKGLFFLGALEIEWKATISFVVLICPSVCMEQHGSNWKDFHEILYLSIFRKSTEKIQVSLNSDKNNGYCTWRPIYIFIISRRVRLRMRNFSNKSCRQNQNTHFIFNNPFFPKKVLSMT